MYTHINFVVSLQIGMAVGETQEERNKAYLSLTKRKVRVIRKYLTVCT